MMYNEFQAIFAKAKPDAPMPTPEAYHETIEPFYMAANLDKAAFVTLYAMMPTLVATISGEIAKKDEAVKIADNQYRHEIETRRKAEAQFKETVDAMAKRQKELEERVVQLAREKNDLGGKVISLYDEVDRLRKRYARLVRGLCDDCLEDVLFAKRAEGETEEND